VTPSGKDRGMEDRGLGLNSFVLQSLVFVLAVSEFGEQIRLAPADGQGCCAAGRDWSVKFRAFCG